MPLPFVASHSLPFLGLIPGGERAAIGCEMGADEPVVFPEANRIRNAVENMMDANAMRLPAASRPAFLELQCSHQPGQRFEIVAIARELESRS